MELLLATTNKKKLEEFRAIVGALDETLEVIGLDDLDRDDLQEPEEDGETFEDNASKKAIGYAKQTGRWCVADDSGLEVDALDGAPGVHSARYAGKGKKRKKRDKHNNKKLLAELGSLPSEVRTARFVCVMALAIPDDFAIEGATIAALTRGEFEGHIGFELKGEHGFGYDPLLITEDGRTSAELDPEEKNAMSHRGQASRTMMKHIATMRKELAASA